MRVILRIVTLALFLVACGESESAGTTTTPAPVTTSAAITANTPNDLEAFDRDELPLVLDGTEIVLRIVRADTPVLRAQGLMGVTDLGDIDGMLFLFGTEVEAEFWMKNTLIPLDIWFFDGDGRYVDSFTMTPCESDPCPKYPAAGPFMFALETEVGRLDPSIRPVLGLAIPRTDG